MTTTTTAAPATPATTQESRPPLTKQDRCDRCNAQAFWRATGPRGVLTFCGHHGNKYSMTLIEQGFIVEDFRHLINDKSESSA